MWRRGLVRFRREWSLRGPERCAWRWPSPSRCLRIRGSGLCRRGRSAEEAGQMFGGNARAEILHVEFDAALGGARAQQDACAGAAVLHGVVDQVREDLVNGFAVGEYERKGFELATVDIHDLQFDILAAGDLAETFFGVVQKRS